MKKFLFSFIFLFICFFLFSPSSVNALTVAEIGGLNYCGNNTYNLGEAMTDGSFRSISCHGNYQEALNAMNNNALPNLIILIRQSDYTSIYDAKYALVDLTANGTKSGITDYMADDTTAQGSSNPPVVGYMNHEATYGSVDGAYLSLFEKYRSARVIVNNFKGYITYSGYYNGEWDNDYQIVPLAWVKSASYYVVNASSITHCSIRSVNVANSTSYCRNLGPKPSQLSEGTYYSYDGKYFYSDLYTMIGDYKADHYNNSVNASSVYYNYYMYLPHRSKTNYSSVDINNYIRSLGYWGTVPGAPSVSSNIISDTSLLYGTGEYFYNSQELYATNAILSLSVSRNESANGRSRISTSKNNGFGHNAVDSDPAVAASRYATFASSIYAHAYGWVSDYANPNDWRSYGSLVGNKGVGMNVKYASDPYWGEKAAMNYHQFDQANGYEDYNYYQLAVTKHWTEAKAEPNSSSKTVYSYRQHDIGMIIVDEVTTNGELWYKVTSEVSLDANKNMTATDGEYLWETSYVYVKADHVLKVNEPKNGYQDPATDTFAHPDSDYSYHFYITSGKEDPRVATTKQAMNYYYDSALTSTSSYRVLANKVILVYAEARDINGNVVSYLVTSNYTSDQQHWVPASTIAFISHDIGYRWLSSEYLYEEVYVSPTRSSTEISRSYHDSFSPIMETRVVDGSTWYRIPVSVDGNGYEYGWVMATVGSISGLDYINAKGTNNVPVIHLDNVTITEGKSFDKMSGVSATDIEHGDLSSLITITKDNLDLDVPGSYSITYSVTDYDGNTVTRERIITVVKDEVPLITASNVEILVNSTFDPLSGVNASDKEDGTLVVSVKSNNVNTLVVGTYEVLYSVTDSFGNTVTKSISVKVNDKEERDALFYLEYLKEVDSNLQIKGYSTIGGIDNNLTTDITYTIKYEDIDDTTLVYEQVINRIVDTNEMTRPVFGFDDKDYTYSWFNGNIDLSLLPVGNYRMYLIAEAPSYYSEILVTNKLYKEQLTSYSGVKEVVTQIDFSSRTGALMLFVRDEVLVNKTASYTYNQFDVYRTFAFDDNNLLNLVGHTASFGMDLSDPNNIMREIIFENKNTYDTYRYDLGSTNQGLYDVSLPVSDNLSKEYAWYDASLDLSSIPVGEYVIYIATSSNITDIAEFNEKLGRNLDSVTTIIDSKKYSFTINRDKFNRIELTVEEE